MNRGRLKEQKGPRASSGEYLHLISGWRMQRKKRAKEEENGVVEVKESP